MPRIPGPGDVGGRRAARPQNVRNIGAEQQAQAEVGETIADVASQVRQRRQKAENSGFVADYSSSFRVETQKIQDELKNAALEGQESYHEVLDKRLQERENELVSELQQKGARPSQSAINRAHSIAARVRGNAGIKAVTYENNVRIQRLQNDLSSSIRGFGISSFNDPDSWQDQITQAIEVIDESGGLVDDPAQKKREARQSITEAAVNGLINKDPPEAIRRLKGNVYDSGLDSETKDQMLDAAGVALRRRQAKQRRQQRENQSRIQSQVRAGLKDEQASINRTGERAGVVSDTMIRAAFPDTADQIIETLHDQQEFYTVRQQTALTTPEEDEEILQSIQPQGAGFAEEAKRQDTLVKTLREKYKTLGIGTVRPGDPVKYLLSTSPEIAEGLGSDDPRTVQQAMTRLVDEQERLGVPKNRRRVLSDTQAENIAGELQAAKKPGQQMAQLQETFGEHFDQAYSELVKAGLPAEMVVLGSVADDPFLAQQLDELIETEERDLKSGLEPTDIKTIRKGVGDQLNEFFEMMEAGDFTGSAADITSKYRSVIEKLAIQNFRRSGDIEQAVDNAASRVILDRYDVLNSGDAPEGRGFAAYVPKHVDGTAISAAQVERQAEAEQNREAIEQFDPAPMGDPGSPDFLDKERIIRTAVSSGFWVTSDSGKELVLMVPFTGGGALPMVNENDERYTIGFKDAMKTQVMIREPRFPGLETAVKPR